MKHVCAESGNVFFLILLGVALFAAFTTVVMRDNNDGGSRNPDQDKLDATQIIQYGNTLKSAVDQLRTNGISESEISFANNTVTGYGTVDAAPSDEVFNRAGGAVSYETPNPRWLDAAQDAQTGYGEWRFVGDNSVAGVGTPVDYNLDCGSADTCQELLAILPYVKKEICQQVNKQVGMAAVGEDPPVTENDNIGLGKFTGTYDPLAGFNVFVDDAASKVNYATTGCLSIQGRYYFFHVLIAR